MLSCQGNYALISTIDMNFLCSFKFFKQYRTAANHGGNLKLGGAYRHVRVSSAIHGHQAGDVMGKNPVIPGIGAFNKCDLAGKLIRFLATFDMIGVSDYFFARNVIWLCGIEMKPQYVIRLADEMRELDCTIECIGFSIAFDFLCDELLFIKKSNCRI